MLTPENTALWITSFRRIPALRDTLAGWLGSFPFTDVNVIANDPAVDYSEIEAQFSQVQVWRNIFRDSWETGSIAWCWNQAMRHTFETRDWCLMSQDDVLVTPGWDRLITGEYHTYIAPIGDTVQLQSLAGFAAVGWFDERFRAIGGPEADYLLRSLQAQPEKVSVHDEHCWQYRFNDVGLAGYWRGAPMAGEVRETRRSFNEVFEETECHARWIAKWGEHVNSLLSRRAFSVQRQPGWDEIDWYPAFTRRLRETGRL